MIGAIGRLLMGGGMRWMLIAAIVGGGVIYGWWQQQRVASLRGQLAVTEARVGQADAALANLLTQRADEAERLINLRRNLATADAENQRAQAQIDTLRATIETELATDPDAFARGATCRLNRILHGLHHASGGNAATGVTGCGADADPPLRGDGDRR